MDIGGPFHRTCVKMGCHLRVERLGHCGHFFHFPDTASAAKGGL